MTELAVFDHRLQWAFGDAPPEPRLVKPREIAPHRFPEFLAATNIHGPKPRSNGTEREYMQELRVQRA